MTGEIINIAEKRTDPLPIPADLSLPPFRDQFIEICETVAAQTGLSPSDGDMVAAIVRSHRRAQVFDQKAADALAQGDDAMALKFSNASERAAGSARTGLALLKATPRERSSKVSRQIAGQTVASSSEKWAALLDGDA